MNTQCFRSFGVLAVALLAQVGCSQTPVALGRAISFGRTSAPLTIGELDSANGTYSGCSHRTGSWSVEIASGATLDHTALSVLLNDSSCMLTLTDIETTSGKILAAPAIALATSYQTSASAFGTPAAFYANAEVSSTTFAADFVITILFSDDPALATGSNTAQFDVVTTTVTAGAVVAPDYTIDVSGIIVSTDVNNIVQTATGAATLTAGSVTGQNFVIVAGSVVATYTAIDAAFTAGTSAALVLSLPATDFSLVGVDLTTPDVETIIVANTQSGVASYESFTITFNPAP